MARVSTSLWNPKDDEIDVNMNYADYYFLEASLRRMKLTGNW
ncbi:MAG TPA: hypothetical protein VJ951_02005 [Bacteroidales bacterium]|nr:hypothetical protein [Bacteroidales bacterium]